MHACRGLRHATAAFRTHRHRKNVKGLLILIEPFNSSLGNPIFGCMRPLGTVTRGAFGRSPVHEGARRVCLMCACGAGCADLCLWDACLFASSTAIAWLRLLINRRMLSIAQCNVLTFAYVDSMCALVNSTRASVKCRPVLPCEVRVHSTCNGARLVHAALARRKVNRKKMTKGRTPVIWVCFQSCHATQKNERQCYRRVPWRVANSHCSHPHVTYSRAAALLVCKNVGSSWWEPRLPQPRVFR